MLAQNISGQSGTGSSVVSFIFMENKVAQSKTDLVPIESNQALHYCVGRDVHPSILNKRRGKKSRKVELLLSRSTIRTVGAL